MTPTEALATALHTIFWDDSIRHAAEGDGDDQRVCRDMEKGSAAAILAALDGWMLVPVADSLDLDAAWAEAEAALAPRHGSIEVGGHPSAEESDRYLAAAHWYGRGGRKPQRDVYEPGPTPAAALRALAAKLRALAFEVDPSV